MRIFLQKLALFLAPLLLIFTFPAAVLFFSGEWNSLSSLANKARSQQSVVIGLAYSEYRPQYQLREVQVRQPQVLALGSSRVGPFRAAFFTQKSFFYNAANTTAALSGFRHFTEKIIDTPPAVIIAGMDQYYFKPEAAKNATLQRADPFLTPVRSYEPLLQTIAQGAWWKVYVDYWSGKFTLSDMFATGSTVRVGLRAKAEHDGFRNDGSNYYGSVVYSTQKQQEAQHTIEALAAAISQDAGDEYGSGISPEALQEVRLFLELCKQNNIFVIGFLPPIAQKVHIRQRQFSEASYAFAFNNLGKILKVVYAEYGFDFYDFTNIQAFGGTDAEMVESKHGGEKMYLRMFITMAEKSPALKPFVDVPYLTERLEVATSSLHVFTPAE